MSFSVPGTHRSFSSQSGIFSSLLSETQPEERSSSGCSLRASRALSRATTKLPAAVNALGSCPGLLWAAYPEVWS